MTTTCVYVSVFVHRHTHVHTRIRAPGEKTQDSVSLKGASLATCLYPRLVTAPCFPLGYHPFFFSQHGSPEVDSITSSSAEHVSQAWPIRLLQIFGISDWLRDGTWPNLGQWETSLRLLWKLSRKKNLLLPWGCWADKINLGDARGHIYHLGEKTQPQTEPTELGKAKKRMTRLE